MVKNCVLCDRKFEQNSNRQKLCNDCKTRKCANCNSDFTAENVKRLLKGESNFCSRKCYLQSRWGMDKCIICNSIINNTHHKRYCSDNCFKEGLRIFDRGRQEKRKEQFKQKRMNIITALGGECMTCGYSDERALEFHHMIKRDDYYQNNYRFKKFMADIINLKLLCANCHRIFHKEKGWGT